MFDTTDHLVSGDKHEVNFQQLFIKYLPVFLTCSQITTKDEQQKHVTTAIYCAYILVCVGYNLYNYAYYKTKSLC